MTNSKTLAGIKAIVGLGNPGRRFVHTRHNIGFLVVDQLAHDANSSFSESGQMEVAEVSLGEKNIILVKPQTYMNNSGKVIPFLQEKGIKPKEVLVVHDELEKKFGKVGIKFGGSARGHNGLRSIIAFGGQECARLWCGIDRPERKEDVGDYVLQPFTESNEAVEQLISSATTTVTNYL